jgi:hypothetical protein
LTHSVEIKAEKELFKQMNKIIKKESTNKQSTTHSTQTDPTPLLKSIGLDDGVIRLIHYLLGTILNEKLDLKMFDSIHSCYPKLTNAFKTEIAIKTKEYFLKYFIKTIPYLEPFEKHQISALVYHDLQELKFNEMNIEILVLCHLIPLVGIRQSEVVIAVLESLVVYLKEDGVGFLIVQDGFEILLKLCNLEMDLESNQGNVDLESNQTISILASTILTNVMDQGTLCLIDNFVSKCKSNQRLLTKSLLMMNVKCLENLSIIISKCSREFSFDREFLDGVGFLLERGLSDFLDLNLKAVLNVQ